MLTIKNIKQLELNFCYQRGLREVTETSNRSGDTYYSFLFGPIGDGEDWNKAIEVRLGRKINEGRGAYELFVMGLAEITRVWITIDDIKNKDGLVIEISNVLAKAKHWWKTKG